MIVLLPGDIPEAPSPRGTTGLSPASIIPSDILLPLPVDFWRYSINYRLSMYPRICQKKSGHRRREIG